MICPTCKGKKTQVITAKVLSVNGWKDEPPVTIKCVTCDGTGEITKERANALERMRKMWCECPKSNGSTYHPDTARMKHHWTCDDCGKITQIG